MRTVPSPRILSTLATTLVASLSLSLSACGSHETGTAPGAPSEDARILQELRAFESERRAKADFGALPPSDHVLGADPYAIRAAPHGQLVGVLRGLDAVVLLDEELHERSRAAAPASPVGLAVEGDTAYVVGERASEIRPYQIANGKLEPLPPIALPDVHALRDVAAGPNGVLYAVEEEQGRLFTLIPSAQGHDVSVTPACAGAFRVARAKSTVIVDCLLAHRLLAFRVDAAGKPEGAPAVVENDGPLWSFAPLDDDRGLLIASGGVENKPLDRTHGSFENIDSFVYLDRVAWSPEPTVTRVAEVNVSEHGVVVPKALGIHRTDTGFSITATGYGGESLAELHFTGASAQPSVWAFPLPPGTNAIAFDAHDNLVVANPLLDEWILYRSEHIAGITQPVPSPNDSARTAASRLGEHLIFTTLIAPANRSNGPLSRFTCETCHFEGTIDGRTHATGRGPIIATTKPLLGLFNNRPHFSRALDPDLSSVANNEFRVAGARSGHDPIFGFARTDRPWFETIGATDAHLTPTGLREAFMAFLMDFSHRTSALTTGREHFTDLERRGAAAFRDRCEICHEARLASDVPASRVPFESWEPRVFSPAAPIVWGQAKYAKTGVLPYVHDDGARVPSLRRLYKKHPYFTNGTAKTLADVLSRARFGPDGAFAHDGAPASPDLAGLSDDERISIEAFLRLL